jgi:hypothetical protein
VQRKPSKSQSLFLSPYLGIDLRALQVAHFHLFAPPRKVTILKLTAGLLD